MSNQSIASFSRKQTAIQVIQILLPLTLVTGLSLSMGTVTEAIESSRPDSARSEVSTDWSLSGYCDHLGVQVKVQMSKPLEERGALARDAFVQCQPGHW